MFVKLVLYLASEAMRYVNPRWENRDLTHQLKTFNNGIFLYS